MLTKSIRTPQTYVVPEALQPEAMEYQRHCSMLDVPPTQLSPVEPGVDLCDGSIKQTTPSVH